VRMSEAHDMERAERLAFHRYNAGVPLLYDDLELVTGYAKSTLENWHSKGWIHSLPDALGAKPRFSHDEVRRILGMDDGANKDEDDEESQTDGAPQIQDSVQIPGPTDGKAGRVPKDNQRRSRGSKKAPRPGPGGLPAHDAGAHKINATGVICDLFPHKESDGGQG